MGFTPAQIDALRRAQDRASFKVEAWVPEKEGDNVGGVCIEIGSMTVPILGVVPTTLIQTEDDQHYSISWGGAIGRNQYERFRPQIGDLIWVHYHGDRKPKTEGFADYQDISYVVMLPDGSPKMPANLLPAHENTQAIQTDNYQDRVLSQPDEPFEEEESTTIS